jgi:oligogalacturonide lyase
MNSVLNRCKAALATSLLLTATAAAVAQAPATPPKTWVDKDTGHRIYRITDEPTSSGFYFNVNAYTPDKRWMVYTAPDGIHAYDLNAKHAKLVVPTPQVDGRPDPLRTIVVGHKTDSVFYQRTDRATRQTTVYKADINTGEVTKLCTMPRNAGIVSINADETLGAGTFIESEQGADQDYGRNSTRPADPNAPPRQSLVQPDDKGQMMERRLAAKLPLTLFAVELTTGKMHPLIQHSTDWINHLLFSPTDPGLLMFCHEGPWQKVDRIWMIRVNDANPQPYLVHKRSMLMEIAGHEFWGLDGETIYYDWQPIKGEDFYLGAMNLQTKRKYAYHMERKDWSIHFNVNEGATLFTGDGGDPGQVARAKDGEWINLFHPEWRRNEGGLDEPGFITPGMFHTERLVNMQHHNYKLEPNVRFSPDSKLIFFTSNMFGPSYVFAVETDKAPADAKDIESTPELGRKITGTPDPQPVHPVS